MTTPNPTPTPREREAAEDKARELLAHDDVCFVGTPEEWDKAIDAIAAALARERREALTEAINAVRDAGGDNEDYHSAAIEALRG